jgi:hypothetical protein
MCHHPGLRKITPKGGSKEGVGLLWATRPAFWGTTLRPPHTHHTHYAQIKDGRATNSGVLFRGK